MASPSAGATALKYGDVNTVTLSPGEVKGLNNKLQKKKIKRIIKKEKIIIKGWRKLNEKIIICGGFIYLFY